MTENPAEIFEWLDGPEGRAWLAGRRQHHFFAGDDTAMHMRSDRSDPAEDPCGRGPINTGATTGEAS